MVERKIASVKIEILNFFSSSNNKVRSVITSLRSELPMLGNKGAKVSHKCFGAQGSQLAIMIFTIKKNDQVHIPMNNMRPLSYLKKMGVQKNQE